jgi:hypothetical protein
MFMGLMIGQWVIGLALAILVSPYAWRGSERSVHEHVYAAGLLGGLLSALPLVLAWRRPGWVVTRHVIAASQMMWGALLIHLTGGRIETHFHVFGSLAFLAFYRDWPVLITASAVVVADHLLRGIFWPESVYGLASPEWWRVVEHAVWVVFIDFFLILSCVQGRRDVQAMAEQTAQVEAMAEGALRNTSAARLAPAQ